MEVTNMTRDVRITLKYHKQVSNEAPFFYLGTPPAGIPKQNFDTETHEVVIHDVRGKEENFSLDKTGFQFVEHVSEEKEFLDEELVKSDYYKEVEELLKKVTGAKRVFIFGHLIRRNYDTSPDADEATVALRGPVHQVHVDQTYAGSVGRVRYHLGDEADHLLKFRVRIINVWRPIAHPVAHNPLGVLDYNSLASDDLVAIRHITPEREGGIFSVRYNPEHRWHYLSDQTPEEVLLIKIYDSDENKACLTPHSAFRDKTSPASAPPRQSIEVRALVFDAE